MSMIETADAFFSACETGAGWEGCKTWCHDNAGFSCQSEALADMTTLAAYADWMKGLLGPIPDGRYELKAFAADEARSCVVAAATFHGVHSGPGGPVAPTGREVATDYVYVIAFDGPKVSHMTKIWNDAYALKALGWA